MTKITISGLPGAGKTTVGKKLAELYSCDFLSVGGVRRYMAEKKGLTIQGLNKLGETDPMTDQVPDRYQKSLGHSNKSFVFEGRLSWYFIPNSAKIFLTVDEKVGAQRILDEERSSEKKCLSLEEQVSVNKKRCQSDIKRYNNIYGIENCYNENQYDIVIDTTSLNSNEVVSKIERELSIIDNKTH